VTCLFVFGLGLSIGASLGVLLAGIMWFYGGDDGAVPCRDR